MTYYINCDEHGEKEVAVDENPVEVVRTFEPSSFDDLGTDNIKTQSKTYTALCPLCQKRYLAYKK